MKIIYRTSENLIPVNGIRPGWCMKKDFKLKCFKSLIDAIKGRDVMVYLIGDHLRPSTIHDFVRLFPALIITNSSEKLGNPQSLLQVFKLADAFTEEEDIIYFCEDDYMHLASFYDITNEFFKTVGNLPGEVFFHPTDYPDQYTAARMRRNYIFYNNTGGWFREVDSTTFTFACKVRTYQKFSRRLKDCAVRKKIGYNERFRPIFSSLGADDGRFSEIFGYNNPCGSRKQRQEAFCFCPLPGLASHMHTGTESLHYNWEHLYDSINLDAPFSNDKAGIL